MYLILLLFYYFYCFIVLLQWDLLLHGYALFARRTGASKQQAPPPTGISSSLWPSRNTATSLLHMCACESSASGAR